MRALPRLAAVAATALFFTAAAHAADTEDLALLPKSGDIVVQIDVKALAGTPLVKGLLEQAKANPDVAQQLTELKTEYGLDPERDVERLTIMFPAKSKSGQALMVINTTAAFEQLLAGAKKNAQTLAEKTHAGVKYHAEGNIGMAQVGKRILIGDEALLQEALTDKGKKGLHQNKQMMGLASRASKAGGQIWFAAVLPEEVKAKMAVDDPRAKDISTVQGSLDLKSGLALRLDIGAKKGTADAMVEEINKQLAEAKTQQAGNPMMAAMGLGAVIDGLKASAEGDEVRIKLDLTQAQVDQLKAMAMMMVGMASAAQTAPPAMPQGGTVTPPPAQPMQKAK
ncbi:MAG: hypothetical protein R3F65_05040 [bacterium]|nr:hypothetical protein [Myxococcales bacterium]